MTLPTEIRLEILRYLLPDNPKLDSSGQYWWHDPKLVPVERKIWLKTLRNDQKTCHLSISRVNHQLADECKDILYKCQITFTIHFNGFFFLGQYDALGWAEHLFQSFPLEKLKTLVIKLISPCRHLGGSLLRHYSSALAEVGASLMMRAPHLKELGIRFADHHSHCTWRCSHGPSEDMYSTNEQEAKVRNLGLKESSLFL